MKIGLIEKLRNKFIKHRITKEDKELLVESIILTIIYLFSFGILSMGRVQQELFGLSETTYSNIQLITLTFIFAIVLTFVLYSLYKKVIK